MNTGNKKFGLGRGLEALLGDDNINLDLDGDTAVETMLQNTVFKDDSDMMVSINKIRPCGFQPRTEFNVEKLEALSQSIKEKGILQPLLVRHKGDGYEIVAGERRWRAAKLAGITEVPVLVKDLDDQETLEIALIENLQRENLSAIEEAEGYDRLIKEYTYTQEDLGKIAGKSRSYIANTIRLLGLPDEIKTYIREDKITAGHARALIGCPQANEIADKIIKKGLSVRDVERIVAKLKEGKTGDTLQRVVDMDLKNIMKELESKLKLKVKINASQNGKGSVTLKYNNPAELSTILDILEQR